MLRYISTPRFKHMACTFLQASRDQSIGFSDKPQTLFNTVTLARHNPAPTTDQTL
jgi:hypothetical protein